MTGTLLTVSAVSFRMTGIMFEVTPVTDPAGSGTRWIRRDVLFPLVGLAVVALLASGCATSRPPLRLRILTRDLSLTPGGKRPVEAVLVNTGKTDLQFEKGAALSYILSCRLSTSPPGQWDIASVGPFEGSVWGGVTDSKPDPADPYYCRTYPPKTLMLPAGASLPLTALVMAPSRCIEGDAELALSFTASDDGRKCPGIWSGKIDHKTLRVSIRRPGLHGTSPPTASPAVLACVLSATAGKEEPSVEISIRNPTSAAWRASAIPTLELAPESDPESYFWAPLQLSEPPAPLPAGQADHLDLPPRSELSRAVKLGDLAWTRDNESGRPARPLKELPAGRYLVRMTMEVLGGRSWEFRCGEASVELRAP